MFDYGMKLILGDVVPLDRERAARFFKSAADKGHQEAKFNHEQIVQSYSFHIDENDDVVIDDKLYFFFFL